MAVETKPIDEARLSAFPGEVVDDGGHTRQQRRPLERFLLCDVDASVARRDYAPWCLSAL